MMKVLLFLAILIIGATGIALAEDLEKEYNRAFELGNKNQLNQAFKEFANLCDNKNYIPACINKAEFLRYGQGTEKNIEQAFNIFNRYAKDGNPYALFNYANMLEYEYGGDPNNLNIIYSIYNDLLNCPDERIQQEANLGLLRLINLELYIDYLKAYYDFYSGKINFEAFKDKLNTVDLNNIFPLIKDKFIAYRASLLEEAKHFGKRTGISDSILWSAKNMAKIVTGDLNPLVDVPKTLMNRDNLIRQRKEFLNAYVESNLSIPLYEGILKAIDQNN